jgi:hypothetical protein
MEQTHVSWAVDELGPALVAFLCPCAGIEAVVVVDNVALGPAIGGVRMRPDITPCEVARLARAMTVKNALAGLPHGGGKAGIAAPALAAADHERVMRASATSMTWMVSGCHHVRPLSIRPAGLTHALIRGLVAVLSCEPG